MKARTLLVALLLLIACSDGPAGPAASDESIGAYLVSLGPWAAFSAPRERADSALPLTAASFDSIFDGVTYVCDSETYEITETPEKVVTFDPDSNILWLGALLQGRGYKEGIGSLAEVPIRNRAPLTIGIDLLTAGNRRVVENPSLTTVNAAIGDLVESAVASGLRAGSSISFAQERTYSVAQAALSLGVSASYMSASIAASLAARASITESTLTAYFVQRMFTVSMELPQSPTDVFSAEFTTEDLEEQRSAGTIGSDNLPVYVSNIAYGRILKFSFTSSEQEAKIRAALSASYGSVGGAEISSELLAVLQEARINVVAVGGEGRNALALIQTGQLGSYFSEDAALTSARPISYTIRNLSDNSIAKVSETTRYDLRSCAARPTTGTLKIDVTPNSATVDVTGPSGYRNPIDKATGDQLLTELQPGGYSITLTTPEGSISRDTTVVAGETTEVHMALTDPIGAVYKVELVDFNWLHPTSGSLLPQDCYGYFEGDPEAYWTFSIDGYDMFQQNKPTPGEAVQLESGNLPLRVALGISYNVEKMFGQTVRITGTVHDADNDADDLMGSWNFTHDPRNGGNFNVTSRLQEFAIGYACVMRLDTRTTRVRYIYE